jgi:hypothetical protein
MDCLVPCPIHNRASAFWQHISTHYVSFSSNPLPINLNLHPTQVHIPRSTRFRHTRRQPGLGLLVVERPLRYREQKSESGAAQTDVESFVDVLGCEANEHGDDAACDEEEGRKCVGEALAAEVLRGWRVSFGWICASEWRGQAYDLAFVDIAGLVEEGVHCRWSAVCIGLLLWVVEVEQR